MVEECEQRWGNVGEDRQADRGEPPFAGAEKRQTGVFFCNTESTSLSGIQDGTRVLKGNTTLGAALLLIYSKDTCLAFNGFVALLRGLQLI